MDSPRISKKKNGVVKSYAVNTSNGLVRNYNEDRVAIILNVDKPKYLKEEDNWPKISFFGIYDGHGGVNCADFLKDNLHKFVIEDPNFPHNPKEALRKAFDIIENKFFEIGKSFDVVEKSGSCALVILIVEDIIYVANVGDSRAVMSGSKGKKIYPLSRDHKPLDDLEYQRILSAGGKIYQSRSQNSENSNVRAELGPYRVFPGGLSVTRTFGDIEIKYSNNIIISTPDIKSFKISDNHDFIVLASDGVFDKLTSREVIQSVWDISKFNEKNTDIHKIAGLGVKSIMENALAKKTHDNITVLLICLKNFKNMIFGSQKKEKIMDF